MSDRLPPIGYTMTFVRCLERSEDSVLVQPVRRDTFASLHPLHYWDIPQSAFDAADVYPVFGMTFFLSVERPDSGPTVNVIEVSDIHHAEQEQGG
jgi:hypothetical protein